MKRRNVECGKLRRPIKRNKITEGMYGSTTVLYMKFLILWAFVITADFMFMFRFEFLWPFWLLLRSVHDSFKYKGLAFSVLFVCIAITSDLVCLFFIPVHWLLFAASTYVWVQYVWHTDKGICLPTIILWMLFVYLEAGIRWKDTRHMPHLDLCRPFAAHCIGYPVVTLGFGFKSYVGYRMRQRKQREVAKENEFYMQLLQQALPQEETLDDTQTTTTATSTGTAILTATASSLNAQNTASNCLTTALQPSVVAITTSSNAIATANGILTTTQAQNNHQQQTVENQSQQNSISNNSSISSTTLGSGGGGVVANATVTATASNSSAFNDDKNYVQISGGGGGNATSSTSSASPVNNHQHHHNSNNTNTKNAQTTSNGHIGGNTKNHRRSVDKQDKNKVTNNASGDSGDSRHNKNNNNNNNYQQIDTSSNNNNNINNSKDKTDWESGNYQMHQTQSHSAKDKQEEQRANTNSNAAKKANSHSSSAATSSTSNGNVMQYDVEEVVAIEPVERTKGRRNRPKKDNASKDNQHHNNNNSHSNNNSTTNHLQNNNHQQIKEATNTHNNNHNSDASSVSSSASSSSSTTSIASSGTGNAASTTSTAILTNLAAKVVSKICESCLKLEADVKKYRTELGHMKQIENELRQKLESNLTTKSCLQAKQKECDELEKRIHEMNNARHADMLQLQVSERRLTEERRQKQSLDALLNNEKKARKLAEEKAARPECSAQCKQRKAQIEEELKQLRRELKLVEEAKQLAEQHGRKWEQELRMFEAEIRSRDSNQHDTELLMNALAAIQDKNVTLEKNLSAETRVKLDLFSALGDAKRQLEISESRRRSKDDEVLDLKAKIAQLLAVMPTEKLCLSSCSSTGASSMLRMNDTPPLQGTGPGPSSPMLNSLSVQQSSSQVVGGHQLNVRGVMSNSASEYAPSDYQQQHQHHHSGVVSSSVQQLVSGHGGGGGGGGSNLDPNASVYTPKGGPGDA